MSPREVGWFVAGSKNEAVRVAVVVDAATVSVIALGPAREDATEVPLWRGSEMRLDSREGESDGTALLRLAAKTARDDSPLEVKWEYRDDTIVIRMVEGRRLVWESSLRPESAPWSEMSRVLDATAERSRQLEDEASELADRVAALQENLDRSAENIDTFEIDKENLENEVFEACAVILNQRRKKNQEHADKLATLTEENRRLRQRLAQKGDDMSCDDDEDLRTTKEKDTLPYVVFDPDTVLREDATQANKPQFTTQRGRIMQERITSLAAGEEKKHINDENSNEPETKLRKLAAPPLLTNTTTSLPAVDLSGDFD